MPPKRSTRKKGAAASLHPLSLADLLHALPIDSVRNVWSNLPLCSRQALCNTCHGVRKMAQQELTSRLIVQVVRAYLELLAKQGTTFSQRFAQLRELELRLPVEGRGASNRLDRHIQTDFLDSLGTCPSVAVLKLSAKPITPDVKWGTNSFTKWQVTARLITSVAAGFPKLRHLQLEICADLTGPVFEPLASSSSLTALDLKGSSWRNTDKISKASLESIARLTALQSLSVLHFKLDSNVASVSFATLTALTSIVWTRWVDDAQQLLPLAQSAPALQSLEFTYRHSRQAPMHAMMLKVAGMTGLKRLIIRNDSVCYYALPILNLMPGLTELKVPHVSRKILPVGFTAALQQHDALRVFTAAGEFCRIADVIGSLPNLEVLRIRNAQLGIGTADDGEGPYMAEELAAIRRIAAHTSLRSMSLRLEFWNRDGFKDVTVEALEALRPLAGIMTELELDQGTDDIVDIPKFIAYLARHYTRLASLRFHKWPCAHIPHVAALACMATLKHVTFSVVWHGSYAARFQSEQEGQAQTALDITEAVKQLAEAGINVVVDVRGLDMATALKKLIVGTTWGEKVACRCSLYAGHVPWW